MAAAPKHRLLWPQWHLNGTLNAVCFYKDADANIGLHIGVHAAVYPFSHSYFCCLRRVVLFFFIIIILFFIPLCMCILFKSGAKYDFCVCACEK